MSRYNLGISRYIIVIPSKLLISGEPKNRGGSYLNQEMYSSRPELFMNSVFQSFIVGKVILLGKLFMSIT